MSDDFDLPPVSWRWWVLVALGAACGFLFIKYGLPWADRSIR